jgi:WD40 repeat protein
MTSGQEIKTNTTFDGTGCTAINDLKGELLFRITKYNYIPVGNLQSLFCAFQKISWMKAFSINESNSNISYGGSSKLGFTSSGTILSEMNDVNFLGIEKVALNTDNTLLAAALDDHTLGIWDTTTKRMVMQLYGPDNPITDLQFTSDGTLLLSAFSDGTIRFWGVP